MYMQKREELHKVWIYFGLVATAILVLFPMLWTVSLSFKVPQDITCAVPKFIFKPTLDNYRHLFSIAKLSKSVGTTSLNFPRYFLNSLIISGFGTLLSLLVGVPAGYALTRGKFKKSSTRENIAFTLLSFWFGPEMAILLPLYKLYRTFGLMDSYIGLILLYQLIGVPFVVWMSRSYFLDIPVSIEDASLLDGYTRWQTFWRIDFPLVKPGIAATAVLTFIFEWNNFVFALVVGGRHTMPVTTGALGFISYEAVLWGQMAGAIVISALPEIILAIIVQKYMIRGLTFGAVRG